MTDVLPATDRVTLSSDDVTALRTADSVTFHYGPASTRYVPTCIRAHARGGYADQPRIWTAREQRLFPEVGNIDTDRMRIVMPDRSSMSGYFGESGMSTWHGADRPQAVAYHMMHYASDEWLTIANLMRAGDSVRLSWQADNNYDALREVGFHADELRLSVHRGESRVMHFLITRSVGPHNSARMIRPDGL